MKRNLWIFFGPQFGSPIRLSVIAAFLDIALVAVVVIAAAIVFRVCKGA